MKHIYTTILSTFLFFNLSAQSIDVSFEVVLDGAGKKEVSVLYCAEGAAYTGADGTDEWGSQVITIGFEPSSSVTALQPNPNFTEFTAGTIAFADAFTGGTAINTFTPSLLGGTDDGNVYASFSIAASTTNLVLPDGECMVVFSFKLPESYGSIATTEMFINNEDLAPSTETRAVINNVGTGTNEFKGSSSSALPIALNRFTATKGEKSVTLDWSTVSEVNGSHFDVQRSRDLDSWTTIGTVEAVGESSTLQEYQLVDSDLPLSTRSSKNFYYRLNMVDNDGTTELSEVRTVRFDQDGAEFIVYPNPTHNEVFVNLSSITTESGPATMNVINMKGERVKQVSLSSNDDISVDVSNITAGVYYFIVVQGEDTFTQKVVKID